jgi:hypothetical protein
MTTEWVSGGGNHFRHHRFTKTILSPRFDAEWVSGGGNEFCKQETRNISESQFTLAFF